MAILSFVIWPCAEQHRHSLKCRPSFSIEFPSLLTKKNRIRFLKFWFQNKQIEIPVQWSNNKTTEKKLHTYFGRTQINCPKKLNETFHWVRKSAQTFNCEYCHPSNRFIGFHWRRVIFDNNKTQTFLRHKFERKTIRISYTNCWNKIIEETSRRTIRIKMLFTPSNSTTGFLLQTMLYVANITKHDLDRPKTRQDFLDSPIGADSGESNKNNNYNWRWEFIRLHHIINWK